MRLPVAVSRTVIGMIGYRAGEIEAARPPPGRGASCGPSTGGLLRERGALVPLVHNMISREPFISRARHADFFEAPIASTVDLVLCADYRITGSPPTATDRSTGSLATTTSTPSAPSA